MASIIQQQGQLKEEFKKQGKQISNKIEQYIQEHKVEQKKMEYEIAKLQWKNKIAN